MSSSYDEMNRVLITDDVDQQCLDLLIENGFQVEKDLQLAKKPDELIQKLQDVDILIVRSATKVTRKIIEQCPRLKLIGRAGTGTDNIDTNAATEHGILVMNTPGGNTISAAEHTCALICSLAKQIPQSCQSLKCHLWQRSSFMGEELFGKTLAIIGLGRIGREVAKRMQSFHMKIIGYDPLMTREQCFTFGVEYYPLDEIWSLADYITIHVPYDDKTKYLINDDVLRRCKSGFKLINVARGGIIDEKCLMKYLNDGLCSGVALDVFEEEPPMNYDLIQHRLVISTPHLGANTHEAQKRVAFDLAQQILDFKLGNSLIGVVNGSAVISQYCQENRSILLLAKRLGQIIGNSIENQPKEIHLSLNHNVSNHLIEALIIYFSYGYLVEKGHKKVNFVNAKHLFPCSIQCQIDLKEEFRHVLSVRIENEEKIKEISGIVSGEHIWLNSVNEHQFVVHVPLENEFDQIYLKPIEENLCRTIELFQEKNRQIFAFFDTKSPSNQHLSQRYCALLYHK